MSKNDKKSPLKKISLHIYIWFFNFMHVESKPERDHFDFSVVLTFFPESFRFVTSAPITLPSPQKSGGSLYVCF